MVVGTDSGRDEEVAVVIAFLVFVNSKVFPVIVACQLNDDAILVLFIEVEVSFRFFLAPIVSCLSRRIMMQMTACINMSEDYELSVTLLAQLSLKPLPLLLGLWPNL